MSKVLIIAGGTASGKTTIARELRKRTNSVLIQHDRYYKDIPIPKGHNFDEPAALDNDLMAKHISQLKGGEIADLPVYHFPTHSRLQETERVHPNQWIIVEGILCLACPQIKELGDLCVYVEAPDDIRLARRIERDVVVRGRNVNGVRSQYLNTVRRMHITYVEPSKQHADLILDGNSEIEESLNTLVQKMAEF